MMKNKRKNGFYIIGGLFFLLVVIYKFGIDWATAKFGITIKELLYTLVSPLEGADTGFLKDAVIYCLPPVLIFIAVWIVYALIDKRISNRVSAEIVFKGKKRLFSIFIKFLNFAWLYFQLFRFAPLRLRRTRPLR
ncbi:MAG: hypothetical protein IJW78_04230 [Clostridia bacterium]|nr:hypothetical protein [Clostridia bacterium]